MIGMEVLTWLLLSVGVALIVSLCFLGVVAVIVAVAFNHAIREAAAREDRWTESASPSSGASFSPSTSSPAIAGTFSNVSPAANDVGSDSSQPSPAADHPQGAAPDVSSRVRRPCRVCERVRNLLRGSARVVERPDPPAQG